MRSNDEYVPAPIARSDIQDPRPRAVSAWPEDLLDRADVISVDKRLEKDMLHLVASFLDVVDGIGEREVLVDGIGAAVCFAKVFCRNDWF
jgi:hypothetical protein